jgi:O-antigen/teichoic acid export membrane protein
LLGPGLLVLGGVQILSSWTIRTGAFAPYARSRLFQSLFVGTGQIVLCALLGGPLSLIAAFLGGQVLAYVPLARKVWQDAHTGLSGAGLPAMPEVAAKYRRFPAISAPSSLLNSLGVEAPILLVSTFAGTGVAGQLALAQRVVAMPGMLVRESLGQAFYTEAARLAGSDPSALRRLYRRTVRHLALIGLAVLAALALAPLAFPLLFGAAWQPAGWMALWLGVMMFSQIATGTVSCLEYLNAQGLNMAWNAGRLLVVAGGVLAPHALGASDVTMVAVYSCASAAWYPMLYAMNELSLTRAIARQPGVQA